MLVFHQTNRVSAISACFSITATYCIYLRVFSSICMFLVAAMYSWRVIVSCMQPR